MSEDLVGRTIAGRYRVTKKLGEGGMGAVYAAVQEPLGREVALKVIHDTLMRDTNAVERFKREATTLSQLAHPNIVTIFDFGNADGVFFLAMELLRGESLRQRVQRAGALPPLSTVPLVRDICSGLAVAHQAGVIHRDLKPDNVMLVDAFGRSESAKILDFGVAKLASVPTGATLTQAGMLVGTPGYMAPELTLHGVTNDPRSDLYALGVMWFEMLVGRALFAANTPIMLVMKHATEAPPRPSDLMPSLGISGEVEELVMNLLAKEPDRRPPSAADIVRQLDAISGVASGALPRGLISTPISAESSGPNARGEYQATVTTMSGLGSFRSISSDPRQPSRSTQSAPAHSSAQASSSSSQSSSSQSSSSQSSSSQSSSPPSSEFSIAQSPSQGDAFQGAPSGSMPSRGQPPKVLFAAAGALAAIVVVAAGLWALSDDAATKVDIAKVDVAKVETAKVETAMVEANVEKVEANVAKVEPPKVQPGNAEPAKVQQGNAEPAKVAVPPPPSEPKRPRRAEAKPATEPPKYALPPPLPGKKPAEPLKSKKPVVPELED